MARDSVEVLERAPPDAATSLPWIQVAPGAPYFVDEEGAPFTPIGDNNSIAWIELQPLWRRKDPEAVRRWLLNLRTQGVTVIRLMLECAHQRSRTLERPIGKWNPILVQVWDDLFALCEQVGMRILLTPVDTFWTWINWSRHPYNRALGGPCEHPSQLLTDPGVRAAVKARLTFAVERWGGSGALFAWDLWNEIHPAQGGDSADAFPEFIHDLSQHVRGLERRLYGRTHPQTVSLFGPELRWRPELPLREPIFRHPDLDFATIHIYATGAIDNPKTTVDAALAMGRIVRECLGEITDDRPFLDSEHGPIHTFKDKRRTLPEAFDDEYFRHMQWAHLASGGAGGGMRWPNRRVHVLTPGMRRAQAGLSAFLPLVDWTRFRRRNLNSEIKVGAPKVAAFGCADENQAVVWLLRRDTLGKDGRVRADAPPISPSVLVPGLPLGDYAVTAFDTREGAAVGRFQAVSGKRGLAFFAPPFAADLAFAIRRS
jgi:mannan endo-1,4-beta-mannosidase